MATISTRKWTHKGTVREAYRVKYKDSSGKTATKQFDRRKDAAEFLKTCGALAPADRSKITVKQAAQRWLDACEKGLGGHVAVEWATLRSYNSHFKLHIDPLLGHLTLSEVTQQVCAQFRDALIKRVNRSTAQNILRSFKGIMAQAKTDGHIQTNPVDGVKIAISKRDRKRIEIPSVEEMRALLAKADEVVQTSSPFLSRMWRRYRAMIYVSAFTGLRASEMRGLPWKNVNLATGILKVTQRADENFTIGQPKSWAGTREIAMAPLIVNVLREWKLECPPGHHDLVFPNWKGNVESIAHVHVRAWYPLQKLAGLMDKKTGKGAYRWHALRHFRASILIASGATLKEVMVEMGHSSITPTFDRYGHLFPDSKGERLRRADDIAKSVIG